MRPLFPRSPVPPDRACPPQPRQAPGHASLRVLLFVLILAAVGGMAFLRHAGAVLPTNLLALVLMGLIYAFVRLEPPRRAARRQPLPS